MEAKTLSGKRARRKGDQAGGWRPGHGQEGYKVTREGYSTSAGRPPLESRWADYGDPPPGRAGPQGRRTPSAGRPGHWAGNWGHCWKAARQGQRARPWWWALATGPSPPTRYRTQGGGAPQVTRHLVERVPEHFGSFGPVAAP